MTGSGQSTDETDRFHGPNNTYVDAICPHCGRKERFNDDATAYAWMAGHIQTEHPDELPTFSNTDTDPEAGDD